MKRFSSSLPARGALDFLQGSDGMASLLPAAQRMARLQQDCMALLPDIFQACAVLQCSQEQLMLGVPNAALATRLKQQLPKLQAGLQQRGWQIDTVRIRIAPLRPTLAETHSEPPRVIPPAALEMMSALHDSLENSARNDALKAALLRLVRRHD